MLKIPFNRPYMTGKELDYISEAHRNGKLAGDGDFSRQCQSWLQNTVGCHRALLTHSCTAALEMCALLLKIQPKDEVIMPSYTFVSTANAFVLRGAIPVFVDIREDTLNINERLIEEAITPRSKAIVPVHYAGVGCEMDTILSVAKKHNLSIVEDSAQGLMSCYKGIPLGNMGDLSAVSFHETKNIICGEGGALFINRPVYENAAEIIREKGTDRSQFFRGEVDKYTWQQIGSSFLPGELAAAFLYAQMKCAKQITQDRLHIWKQYHTLLKPLEDREMLRRPIIPPECRHNAHMYYILLPTPEIQAKLTQQLRQAGIQTVIHYVPLHSSRAGKHFGRAHGSMRYTNNLSARLLRLPMWIGLSEAQQEWIVNTISKILKNHRSKNHLIALKSK